MIQRRKLLQQRANANVDQREFHARGNFTRFQFQLVISLSVLTNRVNNDTNRATVGEFHFGNQIIPSFGREVLEKLSIYLFEPTNISPTYEPINQLILHVFFQLQDRRA